MAIFKRADLEAQGLTKEQADWVMTEGNRSLAANYTLKSDVQAQIDAAMATVKTDPVDPTQSDEYKKLLSERDMLRAIGGKDFESVKPKFREQVFAMLDRGDKAPAVAEQLQEISKKWEEYFLPPQEPEKKKDDTPKNTPQYSQAQGRQGTNPPSKEDELFAKLSENWK